MSRVEAVITDFGGVLTSPLRDTFKEFQRESGIAPEALGQAMATLTVRDGANPLFELETGRMSEKHFLRSLSDELSAALHRPIELRGFGDQYFANLHPNERMIEYMRELRRRRLKLAICTNNVREWEQLWRAKLPVEEIFDVVVDSAYVGTRKPEPKIYEITLQRLGVTAPAALFIDDLEHNCQGARAVGIQAVWFHSAEQAIGDIEAALAEA